MLTKKIKSFFSCKRENSQWLSTLVLNHTSVSNLSTLIAHNYKFFNDSFDNIIFLDLCLKFKKGFNYKSLDCKTKNRYFSELKHLIKDYNFTRCSKISTVSEAILFSNKFTGNDVNFFESKTENCYEKEPDCEEYVASKGFEFPFDEEMLNDIYSKKKSLRNSKKEGNLFSRLSREELIVTINDLSIEDFDIDNLKFDEIVFQHPLEGYEPTDLDESEVIELNAAKKAVRERKDIVTYSLRDIYKNRFIHTDVNHLNRPLILKNSMKEYFDTTESEKSKLVEGFKFYHGIRGFEICGGEKELEEFKGSFNFLKNRLTLMGGVSEDTVDKDTWEGHMSFLKNLKPVNSKLKKVEEKILISEGVNKDLNKRRAELELLKYDLMLKIKDLYPKGTFIEDEYLDRDTSSWVNADLCRFIKAAISYNKNLDDFFTPSEIVPGRSKLSESMGRVNLTEDKLGLSGPEYAKMKKEAELKLRELGMFIPDSNTKEEEYYRVSLNDYMVSKNVYLTEVERMRACVGFELTDILSVYFVSPNKEKEKDLNYRLEKAKKEYNFMIKNKKSWVRDDEEHFLKNLEGIFHLDEDFDKYLTSNFKADLKERISQISVEMASVIKVANSCPGCFNEKQRLMELNKEKDKTRVKTGSEVLAGNLMKFIDSFMDSEVGVTRRGGLKLKEIGESSSRKSKSKKAKLSMQDETKLSWEKNKSENSNKLIKLVNSYKRIYNSLGDTVILDSDKYKIGKYYCTCEQQQFENTHKHYRNATMRNLNGYQSKEEETMKIKSEVEDAERTIKRLNSKRAEYLDFTKRSEELEEENRRYISEREKERLRLIEEIKIKINKVIAEKSSENSFKFMERLRGNWNMVMMKCGGGLRMKNNFIIKANEELNRDFYNNLTLEKVKFFKESITKVCREVNEFKEKKRQERRKKKMDELVKLGMIKPKDIASKNIYETLYEKDTDIMSDVDEDDEEEEEALESYEDYEKKWEKIERGKKRESDFKSIKLIEVSNKYELMYQDEVSLEYAKDSADTFLSNSKNLRLLTDSRLRNSKHQKIRQVRDDYLKKDGYCAPETLAEIHKKCGSNFIKEYSVTNVKPILVLMFLCLVNKVPVDCKFVKINYGMKRCQVNYIYNSIKCSMRILEESINSRSKSINK